MRQYRIVVACEPEAKSGLAFLFKCVDREKGNAARTAAMLGDAVYAEEHAQKALRLSRFLVEFVHDFDQLSATYTSFPDIYVVFDQRNPAWYTGGPVCRRIRRSGYEGPILLHTYPARTFIAWYDGADCVITGNWSDRSVMLNSIMTDLIRESCHGSLRRSVDFLKRLFISHSSADHAFAETLARNLLGAGFDVWYDEWEIKVGDSIIKRIETGIDTSDHLVVILSPDSVKSNWVAKELRSVLTEQIPTQTLTVLPVVYKECDIPRFLKDRRHVRFQGNAELCAAEIIRSIQERR